MQETTSSDSPHPSTHIRAFLRIYFICTNHANSNKFPNKKCLIQIHWNLNFVFLAHPTNSLENLPRKWQMFHDEVVGLLIKTCIYNNIVDEEFKLIIVAWNLRYTLHIYMTFVSLLRCFLVVSFCERKLNKK